MARVSSTAKAGIVLVVLPCLWLGGWAVWHNSRNWVPLRMSLSREGGHIRTGEFRINLEGDYSIDLGTAMRGGDCLEGLGGRWSLSKNGRIMATGKGESKIGFLWPQWACTIGRFHADTGVYILDLDVQPSQSFLVVYEDGGHFIGSTAHGTAALLVFLLLAPLGAMAMIRSAIVSRQEESDAVARNSPLTQPGPSPERDAKPVRIAAQHIRLYRKPEPAKQLPFSKLSRHMLFMTNVLVMPVVVMGGFSIIGSRSTSRLPRPRRSARRQAGEKFGHTAVARACCTKRSR